MSGLKDIVAVSTAAYDGYDFDTIFSSMAALGVKWVEPAFIEGYISFSDDELTPKYAYELKDKMAHYGLSCMTFSAHMDLGHADAVPSFIRRIEFASVFNARIIISNTSFPERREAFFNNIRMLSDAAARAGMRIGLENTGFEKRTLLSRAKDVAPLLDSINIENVAVNYDTANVITHYQNTVSAGSDLAACASRLSSLHLKDTQILPSGDYQMCPLGRGNVDNKAVLDVIRQINPNIPIILELPLRLKWIDRKPVRTPERLPLSFIERSVEQSLDWLKQQ